MSTEELSNVLARLDNSSVRTSIMRTEHKVRELRSIPCSSKVSAVKQHDRRAAIHEENHSHSGSSPVSFYRMGWTVKIFLGSHPNSLGHERIAEAVLNEISDKKIRQGCK